MKDFVIYTVLVGDYDDILQPVVKDDRFDYVLFSNNIKSESIGVWMVKPIPNVIEGDNKRLSRYPKTHPETMLSDYKASLYTDANIQIQDQWVYDRFVELFNKRIEYAGVKLVLTGRDCIYEHSFEMCQWLVEHDYVAIRHCHELYKRGFPRHFGLNENNIIFRIHNEKMKATDEEWWQWIINYSWRDQFSYMYCIWKHQIPLNYFLPEGEDARNGRHFSLAVHNSRPNVVKTKVVKRGFFEELRIKSKRFNEEKSLENWLSIYKSNFPVISLYIDGLFSIISNVPNFIKQLLRHKQ